MGVCDFGGAGKGLWLLVNMEGAGIGRGEYGDFFGASDMGEGQYFDGREGVLGQGLWVLAPFIRRVRGSALGCSSCSWSSWLSPCVLLLLSYFPL